MSSPTKKIVLTALMVALVYVATTIIVIPSPLKGYINLGDCIVLLSGWLLGPWYAFLAAGLGSALADLYAGYLVYAPVTFVIKGSMALLVCLIYKLLNKKIGKLPGQLIGGIVAEIIMILGYFIFEGFLYGFAPSIVNIPANAVQGVAGVMIGTILIKLLEKTNAVNMLT